MSVIGNEAEARYRAGSKYLPLHFQRILEACPALWAFPNVIQVILLGYFSIDTGTVYSLNILYTKFFSLTNRRVKIYYFFSSLSKNCVSVYVCVCVWLHHKQSLNHFN